MSRIKTFSLNIFILIVVSVFIISPVLAQTSQEYGVGETSVLIDPALELSVSHTAQDYPDKKFTVVLTIDSQINSGKVGVEWTYPTTLLQIEGEERDIISVGEGKTTTVEKVFYPVSSAVREDTPDFIRITEIGIRVNAFTAERNYLSTTSFSLDFNKLMEILPLDEEYKQTKSLKIALDWVWKILVVLSIVAVIFLAVKRFIKYLNSDDEVV